MPSLALSSDDDLSKAERCLEKAEQDCLITSSLNSESENDSVIDIEVNR